MLIKNADSYIDGCIKNCDILISDNKIKKIEKNISIQGEEIFDAKDFYVFPGFINTHAHAAMILMRGLEDQLPLDRWLNEVIFPFEKENISKEFIEKGTKLAVKEMLMSGITTFVDMYFLPDISADCINDMGMRAFLQISEEYIEKYKNNSLINHCCFSHAVYTETLEQLKKTKELADKYNAPYQLHLLETKEENENFRKIHGKDTLEMLEEIGFLSDRLILAHCVWLSDNDIKILKKYNVTVSHNPNSNLKLNSGIMNLKKLLDNNINVTLGTDGSASNNSLNIMSEMNIASKLYYHKSNKPTKINSIIDMATKNATLPLKTKIGQIKENYLADLIFIDKKHYSMLGKNPISNLVYSCSREAITHSMINGKWVIKQRLLNS